MSAPARTRRWPSDAGPKAFGCGATVRSVGPHQSPFPNWATYTYTKSHPPQSPYIRWYIPPYPSDDKVLCGIPGYIWGLQPVFLACPPIIIYHAIMMTPYVPSVSSPVGAVPATRRVTIITLWRPCLMGTILNRPKSQQGNTAVLPSPPSLQYLGRSP